MKAYPTREGPRSCRSALPPPQTCTSAFTVPAWEPSARLRPIQPLELHSWCRFQGRIRYDPGRSSRSWLHLLKCWSKGCDLVHGDAAARAVADQHPRPHIDLGLHRLRPRSAISPLSCRESCRADALRQQTPAIIEVIQQVAPDMAVAAVVLGSSTRLVRSVLCWQGPRAASGQSLASGAHRISSCALLNINSRTGRRHAHFGRATR